MQRNVVRNLLFIVTACLLVGGSLLAMHMMMAHAAYSQRVTLQAQTVPLTQHAHLMQPADASLQLNLSIGLQLQNQPGLDQLLHDLSDPQSPRYQQYLTPDQFDQQFAPSPDQVQQVRSYLSSQGIAVQSVSSNNLLINASGTVSQIDQAFNTQINMYQSGGQTFYANTTPPSLPASVGAFVASIGGLDNSAQYAPLYQRPTHTNTGTGAASSADNGNATPTGLGAKDLASAYDMSPLRDSGLLGDNQTIALFELDGYQQSDLNQYFQNYGLGSPSVTPVLVGGASGSAGSGAIEVELDIEVLAALAPHARQLVYEGPNTFQGINQTYNQIVTDNKAHVVSISWGLCESSSGNAELQTLDAIFKQGAAQGMTFFAAAGDAGAYDCQDTNLAVDSPADDPYVTGVGGTNLQLASGAYSGEAVWSDSGQTQRGPKGAGSGGGISSLFKQPGWQSGNGVQNQYSNGNREVPDVTAVADPNTGYSVYCTVTSAGCPAGGWLVLGGTSAAAPLWAGGLTLLNQYLQNNGKAVVGQVNPALYQLFNSQQPYAPFHDVVKGNNLYYPATSSYDVASGLGSPDLYNIARDLLAQGSGISTPTPTPSPTPSPTPIPTATPSPTPMPSPTALPTAAGLIKNGGFENGQSPWQESSSQGYQMVDPTNAHSGQDSAYLCGYMGCDDRLWQTFTVPGGFSKITLTYWWYSDTNKTTHQCLDTFVSRLQNSNGGTIRNLQQACNTNATNTWVQESFDVTNDLSSYRGKQVTLFYRGTNAQNQYQTSDFFVDDVTISVA